MHTSAWNSSNSKLTVACPITALCWAAMVLQTPEIEKSTHFCGCDFRQNELFIKRWILAQCKPINSKLSEHNVNPIVHQVATNYLELLVHLHSWVSNCQIPLPNSAIVWKMTTSLHWPRYIVGLKWDADKVSLPPAIFSLSNLALSPLFTSFLSGTTGRCGCSSCSSFWGP